MKFEKRFQYMMYASAIVIMLMLLIPIGLAYNAIAGLYSEQDTNLVGGIAEVADYDLYTEKPLELNGEWIAYEAVYIDGDTVDYSLLTEPTFIELPIGDLSSAMTQRTYQVSTNFVIDIESGDIVISIPFASESINVYMNGVKLHVVSSENAWGTYLNQTKNYVINEAYDAELEYQEIIISTNDDTMDSDLFKRKVTVTKLENVSSYEKISYNAQGIFVGMMMIIMMIGVMYIVMVPVFNTLTFINLFDTALLFHIVFNMSDVPKLIFNAVINDKFGDVFFRSLDLAFLFVAGYFGCYLAHVIFDPKNRSSKKINKILSFSYLGFAVYLFLRPMAISTLTITLALILLAVTFMYVFYKFLLSYKVGEINKYGWFHFVKTIYFGVLIFIDIFTINQYPRMDNVLFTGYFIFFIIHIVVRTYEYKLPFDKVVEMNRELETTVEERTKELVVTNKKLQELSIKDALTKAYNRLYFEEELRKRVQKYNDSNSGLDSLHLCIFDLDNFKCINDVYGHMVGDDQLIDTVQIASAIVSDDVIFARIGGEEFTMLFTNYSDDEVLLVVESVRKGLEVLAEAKNRTTGSFGVSKAEIGGHRRVLFARADKCLYTSKANGKNRISYDFGEGVKTP
ncbi:MAG: GGDEF domain-containing protein [Eubacteriales bacterium]